MILLHLLLQKRLHFRPHLHRLHWIQNYYSPPFQDFLFLLLILQQSLLLQCRLYRLHLRLLQLPHFLQQRQLLGPFH